jgi:prepilin-type N-terminal cleavage/methylation domain-containing protein
MAINRKKLAGVTLTELVCVLAILAILASFYLGAVLWAFNRVVKFLKGILTDILADNRLALEQSFLLRFSGAG